MHRFFITLVCLFLVLSAPTADAGDASQSSKPKLLLDADTANEIDDMYAIIRLLHQDQFEVVGINSTQWMHYLGDRRSAEASHRVNNDLIRLTGRQDIPVFLGSNEPMGYPWGGDEPRDSDAVRFIIEQVEQLNANERLTVVCIGASTNLASAIKLKPEIVSRIKVYVMGFQLDPETEIWNKSEFNIRRDLNAADFLLNTAGLEMHIMSATVSKPYTFNQQDTFKRQAEMGPLGEYLTAAWKARFEHEKNWVMWDLALVEAILHPEFSSQKQVLTPPENLQRKVWMYDTIDVQAMRDEYWHAIAQ